MLPKHILQAMQNGATIITPNNRLSEQLLAHYLQASQHQTLPKPTCFAYPSFLRKTFKQLTTEDIQTHPRLLSDAHIQALWRHILTPEAAIDTNQNLLNAIHQAFVICENWGVEHPHPAFQTTPQTRQFESFRLQFLTQLKTRNAITEHQLAQYFITNMTSPQTQHILWVCFDDYTPIQRTLQAHFNQLNIIQEHIELTEHSNISYQYIANDKADEYARVQTFIQEQLDKQVKRIGIIVPNLNQEAPQLQRYLKRHFDDNIFDFSLGKPLADYPLITHALQWLRLNLFEISHHEVKLLLNSPYLAFAEEEFDARTDALQNIQLLQERIIPFKTFKYALKNVTPKLFHALDTLTPYPKNATPRNWAHFFLKRLKQLGFPSETSLNSTQYQCFERFITLFDEFMTLTLINPVMNAKSALEAFQDLAKACIFQPEKPETPVNILGLLEASGCQFDAIWMCGATQQNLPAKAHLNAFIPITLQRETNMPYAHAKQEYALAEKRLHRLKQSCDTLVFSYPALLNDIPTLPSPLISHLPELPKAAITTTPKTALLSEAESYQHPFTPLDALTGGSARLSNQALCPFRAFAAHRLHATECPDVTDSPDASIRGQVIHHVLEQLWRTLGSQKALLSCTEKDLEAHIEQAIQTALSPLKKNKPHSFPELVESIENTRLKRLMHAALSWDKARNAFEVEAIEASFTLRLNALEFRVRLDRLDCLASGEKWLIDYKSSIPSPLPFSEERPEAPQLLLYALLDDAIRGLLFIELKKGHVACRGFAEDSNDTNGIKALKSDEHWSTYQRLWHERLTLLADEFYEGHCPPKPKKNSTCQTCRFDTLCRITP
ncbi:MAG: PD-(D/E)XK nuclease family protein [Gammaproteobacteria bacterium]|nr:PD-(D/E)XK nuclease family protein [Gammaproteobacteria bacterium]